jgi:hypothetical protein
VRYECPEGAHASEYDFLEFLWAVNGNAPTTSRGSMADLYSILGNAAVVSNFTWANVNNAAVNHFGVGSAKANNFTAVGNTSGVDL